MTLMVNENDLHLEYFSDFHNDDRASSVFKELLTYPFEKIHYNIGGRKCTPKRLCAAFGEEGLTYSFSGVSITAKSWTPLLSSIKTEVESITGKTYNYVLINYYPDGTSKISAHHDNERSLDPSCDIPTVSYGAKRMMVFTRRMYSTYRILMDHGSLLLMKPPTNKQWKHEIIGEPEIKEPRVSLTFRCIVGYAPMKRKIHQSDDHFPEDDWFAKRLEWDCAFYEISKDFKTFNLSESVSCCISERNHELFVHIQRHTLHNGRKTPTPELVIITPRTWFHFLGKIREFNMIYVDASFICNNSLLVLNSEGVMEMCELLRESDDSSLRMRKRGLRLSLGEQESLLENIDSITDCLIETLWGVILPTKFSLEFPRFSPSPIPHDDMIVLVMEKIEQSLGIALRELYKCNGCLVDSCSQLNHDCLYHSVKTQFSSFGKRAWLALNVENAVQKLGEIETLPVEFVKGLKFVDYEKKIIYVSRG